MTIAVITGASSGLGQEYVRQCVNQLPTLDEIWLVARRKDRLETLAAAYPQHCFRCLALDLSLPESWEAYRRALEEAHANVRLLINNAGYGKLGTVDTAVLEEQTGMVDLNCRALTAITQLTLPYMSRDSGILNVSSIASYAPTPRMAVYCSTKAYVSSFTHCLSEELRPRGIHVLAVCPGPMSTEFLQVADIVGHSHTFQTLPYCQPEAVAENSLKALLRGKRWYTNRFVYKFYRVLCKILPYRWVMKVSKT